MATPPLWASNGLLPSTLMYHEFTWRSCVGWYLPAGVAVPHWLSTGSTKPCLNGFKSAMPSYFSLGICSSWLAPSEFASYGDMWEGFGPKNLIPTFHGTLGKADPGCAEGAVKVLRFTPRRDRRFWAVSRRVWGRFGSFLFLSVPR